MGGWDNWQLIVHEKKPVKDIIEAVLQERKWCEHYNATLNKQVPSRTPKEYDAQYYVDHRDEIMKNQAEYRENHRDKKNKSQAAWATANEVHLKTKYDCPCGGKFTTAGKSIHFKTAMHLAYQATL